MVFYWSRTGASTSNFAKRRPKLLTRLSQLIIKFLIANAKSNQPAKLQLSSKKPQRNSRFAVFYIAAFRKLESQYFSVYPLFMGPFEWRH